MKISSVTQTANGLDLSADSGMLRLQVCADNIIRVVYTGRENFNAAPSLVVLPQAEGQVSWSLKDEIEMLTLSTPSLRLVIQKATGAFTWQDGAGQHLVSEPVGGGKTLKEIVVKDRQAYSTKLELQFSAGEAIYGLGQHEEGILNYRGHSQYLYQHNFKVAMPVIVSSRGYGILFDSSSLSTFRDDMYGSYFWSEVVPEMDFYFIYGPDFDLIVKGLRRLTGEVPLFPKWAYGYVQSKERYKTQAELVEIVQQYRQRGLPLDGIVLDWLSWPGNLWGQKAFDHERFPDPDKMMADLHALNAHLLISVWPKFQNDGPHQIEMRQNGFLLGDDSNYNAFDPQARALFWKQVNEGIFQHGVDGWWCDCTEPFEPDWSGAVKAEPEQRLVTNTSEFKKYLDPQFINAYSLMHSEGFYRGQRAVTSEKRVVNLTRSAYVGQQRYSTITWSGDVSARWEILRRQIPAGLNFTITGNPRWTFDIGGFFVAHREEMWFWDGVYPQGCDDLGYRELFVRWFQMGAFLPMFRAHGTDTPRELWRFGQPGEAFYETLVKFDRLRYRLMPYIYSLAAWETQRGYTMLRALPFDFRHDPKVYDIADQFMLGPALMVCPVLEPMYYEAKSTPLQGKAKERQVYLPAGCDWYDFWTGKRYAGGQTITVAAPLEIVPLFVRAGSILPLGVELQYTGEKPGAPLELHLYPGADGRFDLYDDEGDSYRYEQGEFAWTPLLWDDQTHTLTVGTRQGSYRGMPARQKYEVWVAGAGPAKVQASQATLTGDGNAPLSWSL